MTINSKFAGTCKACGFRFEAGALIVWSREHGSKHATLDACADARHAFLSAPPAPALDLAPVAAFLTAARERGLKWPKARFIAPGAPGREMRLSLAGELSKNPGSVVVKINGEYAGSVLVSGEVRGRIAGEADTLAALALIATRPAEAARAYGALMSHCSFCNLPLTDAGSIEAGYGPICADRYGLPHTAKGSARAVDINDCDGTEDHNERAMRDERNPIMQFAQAINSAPKVADAPYSLTPQAFSRRGYQSPLF